MKALYLLVFFFTSHVLWAQQTFYDVTAGNGNGVRFWQNDGYKIHMGTGTEYQFGPVTDYSIKMNMSNTAGRGWTWGVQTLAPIAAIATNGNMQIAGSFTTGGDIILPSVAGNKQILTWSPTDMNWRIGMSATPGFSRSMATGHVQYVSYYNGPAQGFAIGVNGGQSSFEVIGSNHNAFFRGNVGVGIVPEASLSLRGNTASQGLIISNCDVNGYQSYFGLTTADQSRIGMASESYLNVYNNGKWNFNSANTSGQTLPISFNTDGQSRIFIETDGNVGIGTPNPTEKLTVNGTLYSKEVKVDLSVPGPDYVFEKDYKLPPLKVIKEFIDQNKHLPEVPSAKEMEENGIKVSEMNMLLLKKVEELTLYLIEQQNEIHKLRLEINAMKK